MTTTNNNNTATELAREIINLANELGIDKTELFENVNNEETDFEVDNYRFITEGEALKEVVNMYKYDEYMLGSFNASFIVDFIDLDYQSIKTIQEGGNYDIIGKLIINSGNLEEMMEEYIMADGYGHALCSYDGSYDEVKINGMYYVYFRNN